MKCYRFSMNAFPKISAAVLLMFFSQAFSNVPPHEADLLSGKEERNAIIAAARSAIHRYMKIGPQGRRTNKIPQKFWGDPIIWLNPIRVLNDRVNVFIVLKEKELTSEGLYVSVPISSYAPNHEARFLQFQKLTQPEDKAFGELYRCEIKKSNKALPEKP